MSQETVTLSHKETQRLRFLQQAQAGGITLKEAAELMEVSYRHAKRLAARLRSGGAWGLAHGLRGRPSNRRLDRSFRDRVLARYQARYGDFGPTLACEKLAEEGLPVSRETLRRWLKQEHLWRGRQMERTHRRRRSRRGHFGELVQMDGSDHGWFEERGPACCLMVMIDDATGRVHARFGPREDLGLARATLGGWIERFAGAPQSLYTDRLSLYHATREPTREERRQGSGALTQFGGVCFRLGVRLIPAGSPQAKGRVERMNATLQDRLVKELRLGGISTIEAGNALLQSGFLEGLNARFGREPLSPVNYHRTVGIPLSEALSLETTRQIQNDWTVRYGSRTLQILAQPDAPRAKSRVVIRESLEGGLTVLQGDRAVTFREITQEVILITVRSSSPSGEDGPPCAPPQDARRFPPSDRSTKAGAPGPTARPQPSKGTFLMGAKGGPF